MTDVDATETLDKIHELWPKSADWPNDLWVGLALQIKSLPIGCAQANQALVNLRLTVLYPVIQPAEIMEALKKAVPSADSGGAGRAAEADQRLVDDLLQHSPHEFRRLAQDCHDACECPPHYRDNPSNYARWPRSRKWMADRIRKQFGGPNLP